MIHFVLIKLNSIRRNTETESLFVLPVSQVLGVIECSDPTFYTIHPSHLHGSNPPDGTMNGMVIPQYELEEKKGFSSKLPQITIRMDDQSEATIQSLFRP